MSLRVVSHKTLSFLHSKVQCPVWKHFWHWAVPPAVDIVDFEVFSFTQSHLFFRTHQVHLPFSFPFLLPSARPFFLLPISIDISGSSSCSPFSLGTTKTFCSTVLQPWSYRPQPELSLPSYLTWCKTLTPTIFNPKTATATYNLAPVPYTLHS